MSSLFPFQRPGGQPRQRCHRACHFSYPFTEGSARARYPGGTREFMVIQAPRLGAIQGHAPCGGQSFRPTRQETAKPLQTGEMFLLAIPASNGSGRKDGSGRPVKWPGSKTILGDPPQHLTPREPPQPAHPYCDTAANLVKAYLQIERYYASQHRATFTGRHWATRVTSSFVSRRGRGLLREQYGPALPLVDQVRHRAC